MKSKLVEKSSLVMLWTLKLIRIKSYVLMCMSIVTCSSTNDHMQFFSYTGKNLFNFA